MAMEDRIQGGLKEGAGLEESRLNADFIEFLRKWGTPVLMVIAVVAGGYFLYGRYQLSRDAAMASAFAELDAATVSRNPSSLIRVAEEQSGRAAVPLMARLAAADLYLDASRTGIPAGIQLDPTTGALPDGTVFLTAEEQKAQLDKAATEYEAVLRGVGRDDGKAIHAVSALFGLASVAESRGEMDKAKERYTALIELANRVGFTREAAAAEKRIETLPTLSEMPRIYTQNDLFVVKSAVSPRQITMPDGSTVTIDEGLTAPRVDPALQKGIPDPNATPSPFAPVPPPSTTPSIPPTPTPEETPAPAPAPAGEPVPEPAPGR